MFGEAIFEEEGVDRIEQADAIADIKPWSQILAEHKGGAALASTCLLYTSLPVLQKNLDEQTERGKELESYIVALLAKKRELDQTLIDYQASLNNPVVSTALQGGLERQTRVDDAESAFGRVLARQTGATSLPGGLNQEAGKLKELADLHRNNRIAERLAALKAARGA